MRVNNQIRSREVRVIDQHGQQLGIVPIQRAAELARTASLDLVEVNPTAQPPVCRILDYGKYKYEQTRKEREARKTQKTQTVKEIRFKAGISEHDLDYRAKLLQNFLNEGDKVKVTVTFRGRQNAHPEIGRRILDEVASRLQGVGLVERPPVLEGRAMTMFLTPTPQKPKPPVPQPEEASPPPVPSS